MESANKKSDPVIALSMGAFVSLLLYVYALSYPPFIFEAYLPDAVRIGTEGFVLSLLLLVILKYRYGIKELIWFFLYFATFSCTLLLGMDLLVKTVSSFNKIIFLVLTIALFRGNPPILSRCLDIWIKLWFLLSAMAILAFVGYVSRIVNFSPVDFSESLGGPPGSYYYLNNPLLGNLIPRGFFGIDLGRVAGFMYEGGMLGFFFGFNILVAGDWIRDTRRARRFAWSNLLAGITTLSVTFLFYMVSYFLAKRFLDRNKTRYSATVMFFFPFGVLIVLSIPYAAVLLLEQSSGSARLGAFYVYMNILENNTWLTWLLGNGIGIGRDEMWGVGGIDSGWLEILIQRGFIMLILIAYFLVEHTKQNRWLTSYVIFYNCAFNFLWSPVFLLGIAMHYAYCSGKRNPAAVIRPMPPRTAADCLDTVSGVRRLSEL